MNDYKKELIHLEAVEILKRIEHGRLYGEEIDPKDFEQAIVSAYYLGNSDSSLLWGKAREIDKLLSQ